MVTRRIGLVSSRQKKPRLHALMLRNFVALSTPPAGLSRRSNVWKRETDCTDQTSRHRRACPGGALFAAPRRTGHQQRSAGASPAVRKRRGKPRGGLLVSKQRSGGASPPVA